MTVLISSSAEPQIQVQGWGQMGWGQLSVSDGDNSYSTSSVTVDAGKQTPSPPPEWMWDLIPRLRFISQIKDSNLTVTNRHGDCSQRASVFWRIRTTAASERRRPPKGFLLTPNTRFSFPNTNLPVGPDGTSRLSRCPQRLNLRQTGWLIRFM